jgi:N-acetylneuraminate synthase
MKPLVVFELANNHQGSLAHGLEIVRGLSRRKAPHEADFDFAVKFQFRDLDSYLDPAADPAANRHLSRFRETRLDEREWSELVGAARAEGFLPVTTPFDERSVELAGRLGITTLKIASASAQEWTLLRAATSAASHLIVSTAGLRLDEVDALYSYLRHECRGGFTLLHCVGIYPAPLEELRLSTIRRFVERYPKARIGWSGHEPPDAHRVSALALALGARVFERHVGLRGPETPLNAYSLDVADVEPWLDALADALRILGEPKSSGYTNPAERESLDGLRRGAFAGAEIPAGQEIDPRQVRFHFPLRPGQVGAGEFTSIYHRFHSTRPIAPGEPLDAGNCRRVVDSRSRDLDHYVQRIRGIATEAHVEIADDELLEISHHYGVGELWRYGCCIINVLNRSYCKKLILMAEGQQHPEQYHRVKEETLRVVHGRVELVLEGAARQLEAGQSIVVEANARHAFRALTDAVIEELSTTSSPEDSYYTDPRISSRARTARKSMVRNFLRSSD